MAALRPIKSTHMSQSRQGGFSLIEILVAMSLLAFGLLAVALNTTKGLKSKVDTEIHSRAMQVSSVYIEPLNRAIEVDTQTFINQLQSIGSESNYQNFTLKLSSSQDAAGNDITQTPTAMLSPPFTLVLDIQYQKDNSSALQFASTHVFVPTP